MLTVQVDKKLQDLASFNWGFNYHRVATADLNQEIIKASPALLLGWSIFNNAPYPVFVKILDTTVISGAGALRVGKTIGVPAGGGSNMDLSAALIFQRGMVLTITKLVADTDATPLVAGDCVVDLHYR